jgi:hypothetical protein
MFDNLRGRRTQFYIDVLYGVLFLAAFAYLVYSMTPAVAGFAGGLVVGYFLHVWEKMVTYERILQESVSAEAERQVSSEVDEQVGDRIEERVGEEVEQKAERRVEEKVEEHVEEDVKDRVQEKVDERVQEHVEEFVDERVEERVGEIRDADEDADDTEA